MYFERFLNTLNWSFNGKINLKNEALERKIFKSQLTKFRN